MTSSKINSRTGAAPPLLSVAMIVRDAASLACETLDSVRAIADELVVLDTGSTDGTVEAAREAGANVFETTWQDDFSMARNECAQHINGQWVLWLDAGETIDNLTAQQLRQFVEQNAQPNKAYLLYVAKPEVNAVMSREQIGQVRLLPNDPQIQFAGRVRETVIASVMDAGMEVDALNCRIDRPESDVDTDTRKARAERNLRIADAVIADGMATPTDRNVRAQSLTELERKEEAIAEFMLAIATATDGSTEMLEAYYGLLSIYEGQPQYRDEQATTCLQALEVYPLDAQLLCGMGCYLLNQQRLDLASRSYELAATHGQVDPGTWHLAEIADVAVACQCLALQLLGDEKKAQSVLEAALEIRPESEQLRRQLIAIHIKAGREKEALAHIDELPDLIHMEAIRDAVAGAVMVALDDSLAGLPKLKAAYETGCRDAICLRWLTTAHLKLGNSGAAGRVLADWQGLDPQSPEVANCLQMLTDMGKQPESESSGSDNSASSLRRFDRDSSASGVTPIAPLTPENTISQPPSTV